MSGSLIRVVIVDDEPVARRGTRHLLTRHADFELAGEARNGKEAVRVLKALVPDLVFLDVQMPELDGFEVLRQLDPAQLPWVIFVTAFDSFAVRAFESHALDYLVKPVSEARFHDALNHARTCMRTHDALERSHKLAELLADGAGAVASQAARAQPQRRLLLGTSGSSLIVDVDEVDWIEADDYYAAVHSDGKRHLVRESLASLEARLDRSQFVRVHRGVIVNLARVRGIAPGSSSGLRLLLRNGHQLPLSRRRRRQVEAALSRLAR